MAVLKNRREAVFLWVEFSSSYRVGFDDLMRSLSPTGYTC